MLIEWLGGCIDSLICHVDSLICHVRRPGSDGAGMWNIIRIFNTSLKGGGERLLVLVLNRRLDMGLEMVTGKSAISSGWWGELCSDEGCGQDGMEHCIFLPSIPGTPYPDVAMLPGAGWDGLPPSCYPQEHAEHPILIIPIPIPSSPHLHQTTPHSPPPPGRGG